MLFSHISDTHLGMEQYGLEERSEDVYRSFNQAIDISIKDRVNFVVFAGDIFHTPSPSGRAVVEMANALKRLKNNKIESYFILGEHDISRLIDTPIHYVYHNLEFTKYVGQGEPIMHNDVMIAGLDKIRRSEIHQYEDKFVELGKKALEHNGHKIMIMHQGVTEFNKFAGEIQSTEMPANFTYYAMGHLHDKDIRYFEHLEGPIAYPGSTEMSPNENIKEGIEKGFYIVDISTKEAKPEWKKLDIRPRFTFDTEYDNLEEAITDIAEKIKGIDSKDQKAKPIVEIKIKGQSIKADQMHNMLAKIEEDVLCCVPRVVSKDIDQSQVLQNRPSVIDDELLRLSTEILESKELAEFAINRLLPSLISGVSNHAADAVWDEYVRFKDDKVS